MSWTQDTSRNLLIGAVFAAIITLIVCAGSLTQSNWRFQETAGPNTGFAAPASAGERR